MYKTKLQELCHKKNWVLPQYSCLKDGPDHNPSFTASVTVNGVRFQSSTICKSSKDAQNDAAMVASRHFTSDKECASAGPKMVETCKKPDFHPNASSNILETRAECKAVGPEIVEGHQSSELHLGTLNTEDAPTQYKMMLQTYAQRNKLGIPVYSSERQGPPHRLCFKAKVTVDEHLFESPGFYKTLKEAEHAVAQVALMSLSIDAFTEKGSHYKNSLQELAQSEGFSLPKYRTIKSGEPHNPTFFSTVEVEGETFRGAAAKTKKLAESNAAKVAYTAFMKNKANRSANISSAASSEEEVDESLGGSESLSTVNSHGNFKSGCSSVLPSTVKDKEQTIEIKDKSNQTANISSAACSEDRTVESSHGSESLNAVNSHENQNAPPAKNVASPVNMDEITGSRNSYTSPLKSSSMLPTGGQSPFSVMTPPDLSVLSIEASNVEKPIETESFLLNSRFRVYKSYPNIDFPKGTVVLPIGDDKWVPVSLEFPKWIDA